MSKAESKVTFDHEVIRHWAEARQAQPACVKGTGKGGNTGMIRLDFPGYSGEISLQPITWEEWFAQFDQHHLALLYQETTASGEKSNFNKLVSRETAESAEESGCRAGLKSRTEAHSFSTSFRDFHPNVIGS